MDRLISIAFRTVLRNLVHNGSLRITTAAGTVLTVGNGIGTSVAIRFTSYAAEWGVLADPELKVGEAYVDGGLVVECGSIADLLDPRGSTSRTKGASLGTDAMARSLYSTLREAI